MWRDIRVFTTLGATLAGCRILAFEGFVIENCSDTMAKATSLKLKCVENHC